MRLSSLRLLLALIAAAHLVVVEAVVTRVEATSGPVNEAFGASGLPSFLVSNIDIFGSSSTIESMTVWVHFGHVDFSQVVLSLITPHGTARLVSSGSAQSFAVIAYFADNPYYDNVGVMTSPASDSAAIDAKVVYYRPVDDLGPLVNGRTNNGRWTLRLDDLTPSSSGGGLAEWGMVFDLGASTCGDGVVSLGVGERCDDGASGGCSLTCTAVAPLYSCDLSVEPSVCTFTCGNGVVDHDDEECDDGDLNNGDGCDSECLIEPTYACTSGNPSFCIAGSTCGDGVTVASEVCDDGNVLNNDGCSPACVINSGHVCELVNGGRNGSVCHEVVCGDNIVEGDEECDGDTDDVLCTVDCYLEDTCRSSHTYTAPSGVLRSHQDESYGPPNVGGCVFTVEPPGDVAYFVFSSRNIDIGRWDFLMVYSPSSYELFWEFYQDGSATEDMYIVVPGPSAEIYYGLSGAGDLYSPSGFEISYYTVYNDGTPCEVSAAQLPTMSIVHGPMIDSPPTGSVQEYRFSGAEAYTVGFRELALEPGASLVVADGNTLSVLATFTSASIEPLAVHTYTADSLRITLTTTEGVSVVDAQVGLGGCPGAFGSDTAVVLESASGSFADGSGAAPYGPNLECVWKIEPGSLPLGALIVFTLVEGSEVVGPADSLQLREGSLSAPVAAWTSSQTFYGSSVVVVFNPQVYLSLSTNGANFGDGFSLEWEAVVCPSFFIALTSRIGLVGVLDHVGTTCRYSVGSSAGPVALYFDQYPIEETATLAIKTSTGVAIPVNMTSSGFIAPLLVDTGGPVTIEFSSPTVPASLIIRFQAASCGMNTALRGTSGFITDGTYSTSVYANYLSCTWTLQADNHPVTGDAAVAVDIVFEYINIEDIFDRLAIYDSLDYEASMALGSSYYAPGSLWVSDGSMRGGTTVRVSAVNMTFTFFTDYTVTQSGFLLWWNASYACNPGERLSSTGLCVSCLDGESSEGGRVTSCTACPAGQYSTAGQPCSLCPPGKYSAQEGSPFCDVCPRGYESRGPGATRCFGCSVGYFAADPQTEFCDPCPPGSIARDIRSTECEACPSFTSAPIAGMADCIVCGNGSYGFEDSSLPCQLCSPGWISNTEYASECTPCPLGSESFGWGGSSCRLCSPGTFAFTEGTSSCSSCLPGTYARSAGSSTCRNCDFYSFTGRSGADECEPCPRWSETPQTASTLVEQCLCIEGYYRSQLVPNTCNECPDGATCSGEPALPVPQPGYWSEDPQFIEGETEFIVCNPPESCSGGSAQACAEGYSGFRCGSCALGLYYKAGNRCEQCPQSKSVVNTLLLVTILIPIVFIIFALRSVSRSFRSGSAAIFYDYVQTTSLCAGFDLLWPRAMSSTFNALSFFYMNVDLLQTECTFQASYLQKYVIIMAIPIMFAGAFVLLFFVARLLKSMGAISALKYLDFLMSYNFFVNGYLMFLSIFHPFLTGKAIEPFVCIPETSQPDARSFMEAEPSIYCFEEGWWPIFGLAIYGMTVYAVGIPLLFFLVLYRNRGNLDKKEFKARYGALFIVYRKDVWYWELVIKIRKLLLQLTILFFPVTPSGRLWQAATGLLILFAGIYLNVHWEPFRFRPNTRIQFVAAVANFFFLLTGLMYFTEKMSPAAATVLITITLTVLIAVGLYLFRGILQELAYAYKWKAFKKSGYRIGRPSRGQDGGGVGGGRGDGDGLGGGGEGGGGGGDTDRSSMSITSQLRHRLGLTSSNAQSTGMTLIQEQTMKKYLKPQTMTSVLGLWQVASTRDKRAVVEAMEIIESHEEEMERSNFELYRRSLLTTMDNYAVRPIEGTGREDAEVTVFELPEISSVPGARGGSQPPDGLVVAVGVGGGGGGGGRLPPSVDTSSSLSSYSDVEDVTDSREPLTDGALAQAKTIRDQAARTVAALVSEEPAEAPEPSSPPA